MATIAFDRKPGRRRKKGISFDPNKEFLSSAVEDFIKKGGKIKKIDSVPNNQSTIVRPYRSAVSMDVSSFE